MDDITFVDARPTIEVGDLTAALAFWVDVVGLPTEVVMGEPPMFAIVAAGGARLGVSRSDDPFVPAICPVFVTVSDLDALVARFVAAGIELDQPPTRRPWGIRDLVVRCPGGGPLVAFGEMLSSDQGAPDEGAPA